MVQARRSLGFLGALALLLAACGPAAEATPTPTVPLATPTPTATPLPPPRATPGATPAPQPTPTPTPAVTPKTLQPKYGGTIRMWAPSGEPASWDQVNVASGGATRETASLVLGMYFVPWREPAQGCQRDPYPLLVEKWRWLDDVTAEFTLRPGVRFHNKPPVNGRELVAADFSAFFEERYRKFSQPENKTRLVKSVSVTSKHVFEMKMVGPWGGLISDLFTSSYGPWVEAKEAGGREGELWGNPEKAWIGVGPFMFERWMPAVKAALVRNPDYWVKGLPYLDRVEVLVIPDVSTRFAALVSGKLDMSKELPEEIMAVGERLIPGLQVVRCPGDSVGKQGVLSMGTNAPPFNDVRVRRAISMAINRQFILDGFYLGRGTYPHVTSPSMLYGLRLEDFPRELRQYFEFNPDRARQLLAEAGYPNGFATTIHAWRGVGSPHDLIVEAVAAQLVEVGIKAKLDFMERGAYTAVVFPGKYPDGDMAVHAGLVATPEEAHALSAMWSKGGRNISRINSPEYDRLFERYVVTVDEGQRLELARQLQIMAAENMWRVMLYIPDAVLAVRPGIHFTWLGGGTSTDMSMTLRSAWRE